MEEEPVSDPELRGAEDTDRISVLEFSRRSLHPITVDHDSVRGVVCDEGTVLPRLRVQPVTENEVDSAHTLVGDVHVAVLLTPTEGDFICTPRKEERKRKEEKKERIMRGGWMSRDESETESTIQEEQAGHLWEKGDYPPPGLDSSLEILRRRRRW